MDLSAIKPETVKVDIFHPGSAAATGFVIEVTSNKSDAVKRVERRHTDRMLRQRSKKLTSAEFEAHNIERLAAAVVGWDWGKADWGGKKLDFNKENVATVLSADWVRIQIEEVVADDAAFFSN